MIAKKKIKTLKKKSSHPEATGLFLIAFAVLFLISLFSFSNNAPSQNFLGIIGYSVAWIFTAFMGLGGYLFGLFIGCLGWQYLASNQMSNIKFKAVCFSFLLFCICILLNLYSEINPGFAAYFSKRVFTDTIYITAPSPHFHQRYNLGGIPFYFIYKDFPIVNLEKLLSREGTILIFSTGAVISFLLLLNIHIVPHTKALFSKLKYFFLRSLNIISIFFQTLPEIIASYFKGAKQEPPKQNPPINTHIKMTASPSQNVKMMNVPQQKKEEASLIIKHCILR